MARPIKDGVDYFPKDTDFYEDDKVRILRARFGSKGMYLLDYLLCDLYSKNGYYMDWDKNKCFLVSDGAGCECSIGFVQEFITGCLQCSFFDERVFKMFGILTSKGIQRRYIRMFNSRDEIQIIKEYWLLDISNKKDVPTGILNKLTLKSFKSTENPDKSTENPDKSTENPQSKTDESKTERNNISSEQSEIASEHSILLLLQDGSQYKVNDDDLKTWAKKYEPVNVFNELEKMRDWFSNNEEKRKTQKELIPFINRWLAKAKTKTGGTAKKPNSRKPDYSDPNYYSAEKDGDINDVFA